MSRELLYVGTHRRPYYSDQTDIAFGIYGFSRREDSSSFCRVSLAETAQPGWIALHPNRRFLYTANEVKSFEGMEGGGVSAFAIDLSTGSLTPLNSHRTSFQPCHCAVDSTGRYLVVANYGGATVNLFCLMPDGQLGPESDVHCHSGSSVHPLRQAQPHPHAVNFDPANRFVFVPDLGLDQIFVYELDRDAGKLVPRPRQTVQVTAGSGPRHMAFDPHGRFAYLVNEMNATATAFAYDASSGTMQELQTIDLLPEGFEGYRSAAEIAIHPSGRFVYATTRSHGSRGMPPAPGLDLITWCAIHPEDGTLGELSRIPSGGGVPRSFTFDQRGEHMFVAHQTSGTVVTFRIHPDTGEPVPTGDVISTPAPVCLCLIEQC